jgi:hypothetical protein
MIFEVAGATGLARVPLLPLTQRAEIPGAARALLDEAVFLASRQAGDGRPDPSGDAGGRLAAAWRAYEIRARTRPTPHGVFVGVASARFAPSSPRLRLAEGHTARTYPSGPWLAEVAARLWRVGAVGDPLAAYHDQFLERYGAGRCVPLLEATDPVVGIGLPTQAGEERQAPSPRRDAALASLAR